MKVFDNEGTELNVGDKVVFCMGNVNRTAWFYELRTDEYGYRALFSSTNPKIAVNYMGYENLFNSHTTVTRAIKV